MATKRTNIVFRLRDRGGDVSAEMGRAIDWTAAPPPPDDPPPDDPPPTTDDGVPYAGAAKSGNGDVTSMETSAGRSLGLHTTYWNLDQITAAINMVKADQAKGRISWISFKAPSKVVGGTTRRMTWAELVAGEGDAKMTTLSNALAGLHLPDGRVWVDLHHEPQGDSDGTSTEFQQYHDRLFDILRATAPEVWPSICLIAWNTYASGNANYALPKWWPSHGVKVYGLDFYNPYGTVDDKTGAVSSTWAGLSKYADKIAADAKARGAAWAIRETGQTDAAFAKDPTQMGKDFDTMADNTIQSGIGWSYFDSALNSGANTWPLGNGAKRDAFNAVLNRSHA